MMIGKAEKLYSELDQLGFKAQSCLYSSCDLKPVKSHTISKNMLYKLNEDLSKLVMHESSINYNNKGRNIRFVNAVKFSTFEGFCQKHDNELFETIDNYDGKLTAQKSVLTHYRIICYGICHIHRNMMLLEHLSKQNYYPKNYKDELDFEGKMNRLKYVLNEHEKRKGILENILLLNNYTEINFECIKLQDNKNKFVPPIFFGRANYLLNKDKKEFQVAGYDLFPWISYITLINGQTNHLVFSWLKQDEKYTCNLRKMLYGEPNSSSILEGLIYCTSDGFAMTKEFYEAHKESIQVYIENFRSL